MDVKHFFIVNLDITFKIDIIKHRDSRIQVNKTDLEANQQLENMRTAVIKMKAIILN